MTAAAPAGPVVPDATPVSVTAEAPAERVGAGLALALVSIPAGALATLLLWKIGFISSLTAFLTAAVAVALYRRGAGQAPQRGVVALIGIILAGLVGSFFAVVASDLVDYRAEHLADLADTPAIDFVLLNILNPSVLASFTRDGLFMALFAFLGTFGTLRRLRKSPS